MSATGVTAPATQPLPTAPSDATSAWARRSLWRLVYSVAGGLTVTGTPPEGPAVVVANHSSHADTAALLGALPHGAAPVVVAAADYWFEVPWRRALVSSVVAALPVSRDGGGYAALRAAVAPALAESRVVVVYPEGTRTCDGSLGEFHSGATRLAAELGVPVVPSAVVGTREAFPKHGRVRRVPVEVRFGPARHGLTAAEARTEVAELLGRGPAATPATSRVWRAVHTRVTARTALLVAVLWGVAEALSWPVLAEMSLVLLGVAAPRRLWRLGAALAAGSVLGVTLHAWLAWHGLHPPLPVTTPRMAAAAAADLRAHGGWGVLRQALSGIPVKVYAAQAPAAGVTPWELGLAAAVERPLRVLGTAALLCAAARAVEPWLRRWYGWYLVAVVPLFAGLWLLTVRAWS